MARCFVVVGRTASASPDFSLDDLPSTSGRLDVLLRCVRAALLVSHEIRRDTVVYLVLLGGAAAPRSVRIDGATAKYVRPDERSLAGLVRRALDARAIGPVFTTIRPGIARADGGIDVVLADIGPTRAYVLDENAIDVRDVDLAIGDATFFVGDHLGLDDATRAQIAALGAVSLGIGPLSLHADDAITILSNELDRRIAKRAQ